MCERASVSPCRQRPEKARARGAVQAGRCPEACPSQQQAVEAGSGRQAGASAKDAVAGSTFDHAVMKFQLGNEAAPVLHRRQELSQMGIKIEKASAINSSTLFKLCSRAPVSAFISVFPERISALSGDVRRGQTGRQGSIAIKGTCDVNCSLRVGFRHRLPWCLKYSGSGSSSN